MVAFSIQYVCINKLQEQCADQFTHAYPRSQLIASTCLALLYICSQYVGYSQSSYGEHQFEYGYEHVNAIFTLNRLSTLQNPCNLSTFQRQYV